jgi:hypothetical protein
MTSVGVAPSRMTCVVTLPSTALESGPRPCELITITLPGCAAARSRILSPGIPVITIDWIGRMASLA